MRHWMPFLAGAVVGGFVVNGLSERQRAKLASGASRIMNTTTSRPAAVVVVFMMRLAPDANTAVADRIADEPTAS